MTEREQILEGLAPMYADAKKKGLWFYANYQDMWFSPRELSAAQASGKFMWGAVNWKLRDPQERVVELQNRIKVAENNLAEFKQRMESER